MKWTWMDWTRSVELGCLVLLLGLSPAALAQPAPGAPAQNQPVDAPTKKLMAANGLFQRGLFKLAAHEYQEFLEQYPQHTGVAAARYALGVCQYRLGDFNKAVELLNPIARDPQFEQKDEALAVLGYCELSLKHYDKALADFDELSQKYPASKHAESAALYRAQVLYLANQPKQADEAADAFIGRYPKSAQLPAALYFKALAERALGQDDQAVQTLSRLTKDFPDSRYQLDSLLLSGQSLESQGKLDAAIEQYRRMLAAAPETRKADAEYSLGVALYKAGKYDEAIQQLKAVDTDGADGPDVKPARLQLGLVQLAAGKVAEARTTLSAVAQGDPVRAADARYGLAECDMADKKFEPAHAALDQLARLQSAPANLPQILLDRAVCLMELGKFEDAALEFAELQARDLKAPQVPEAMYRQAFCLHKLGKFDQSHAICQALAKLPPSASSGPAAELDAENLFLLGKYAEAEKAFTALSAQTKDESRALRFRMRIGQCEYFSGNYAGAVERLSPLAADARVAQADELQPAIFLLGDALLQQGKDAEAIDALKKFLAVTKGDKLETQYKLALAQLGAKDTDGARATLAQVTSGPLTSPWVQRSLFESGQLDYKAGKPEPAAAALNKVLAANPPAELAAPATYLLGWVDFDAKRFTDAAARWKQVQEKYPDNKLAADAAFQQGVALKEAGKNDEALAILQSFAAAHPDNPNTPRARQIAAACLTAQGKHDQAATILTSLAADPKAADTVLYDLAWAQRNTRNTAGAQETYRRLLKDHPDSKLAPATRTELAEFLYADKKYDEAVALLEAVVADKQADPKVVSAASYRLGWCYDKLGKPDKAAAVFGTFEDAKGDDEAAGSALLQAGLASAEQGKADQAEKYLSDMLRKYPQDKQAAIALLKLGEVQNDQSKYDAAYQTFTEFLQKYPKDEFAYRATFGLGWSLENRKQYQPAREAYEKVIAANNGETAARAQFQIGETFLAEQKFEQAVPALLAVEDVYAYPKWSARALYEAGRAFEQLKEVDQARRQYTQLRTKYKDAPEAEMAQDRLKNMTG